MTAKKASQTDSKRTASKARAGAAKSSNPSKGVKAKAPKPKSSAASKAAPASRSASKSPPEPTAPAPLPTGASKAKVKGPSSQSEPPTAASPKATPPSPIGKRAFEAQQLDSKYVMLQRDVDAIAIPDGKTVPLHRGERVKLTQALGFSYTVQTERGGKFRIAGKDGDAIGQPVVGTLRSPGDVPRDAESLTKLAREQLKGVYDPEIPIDIINLGLVHTLKVTERPFGGFHAEVRMGLTAPGCGMGDVLVKDVEAALRVIPGMDSVDAKVVLFPVWNPHTMMSDAAKLKLGML